MNNLEELKNGLFVRFSELTDLTNYHYYETDKKLTVNRKFTRLFTYSLFPKFNILMI